MALPVISQSRRCVAFTDKGICHVASTSAFSPRLLTISNCVVNFRDVRLQYSSFCSSCSGNTLFPSWLFLLLNFLIQKQLPRVIRPSSHAVESSTLEIMRGLLLPVESPRRWFHYTNLCSAFTSGVFDSNPRVFGSKRCRESDLWSLLPSNIKSTRVKDAATIRNSYWQEYSGQQMLQSKCSAVCLCVRESTFPSIPWSIPLNSAGLLACF